MNIASIDIGTNTILLLIAEIDSETKSLVTLHEEIRIPRIGSDLNKYGVISKTKIDTLIEILFELNKIVTTYRCTQCFVIGTHALRSAANSAEIAKTIEEKTSLKIEIVSPETEADFAFYGVQSDFTIEENFAIIDIGGGSTEVIIGNKNSILAKTSIPIGVVTLKENFISKYPVSKIERINLKNKIEDEFKFLALNKYAPKTIIGISGTPTTISAIANNQFTFDATQIHKTILSFNKVKSIVDFLSNSTVVEIKEKYQGIISQREDILYVGGEILLYLMSYFGLADIKVSIKGIRHGCIYQKMFINK